MKIFRFVVAGILVCLCGFAVAADRPTVGVVEFKNETNAYWWKGGIGWDLANMLTNELVGTGVFRVVERSMLESVLAEQNLAASGRAAPSGDAQIGRLESAPYLIMGTVTAFEGGTKSTGGGIRIKGFSIGGKKTEAYLAIDLRVVDSTTGVVEYVRTVEGRSGGSGVSVGYSEADFGGALATESNTPVGKAIRGAVIEATDYLACVMYYEDECMDDYYGKERRRRTRSKDAIDLD